ncbi:MAG: hypothetical protein KDI34_22250, partial [Halioglobus sp.]|nr:hypothetical protein [Halioglobus sp.]
MIEHCLYGVKVFCDIPLFDRPVPVSAVAPGEHAALRLCEQAEGRQAAGEGAGQGTATLPETFPLYQTHGRELYLDTDRELARSAPGQSWCLRVEGVVSFSWTGGQPVIEYQL